MNQKHLDKIFQAYVNHFETLTNSVHDENYKWVAIQKFQTEFNIEAPDFAAMFANATSETCNLINDRTQPLFGIIECAKKEPEEVRKLFLDLYAPDYGDLDLRQEKIDTFINKSNLLKEKYFPGSWRYAQTQRSAMAYLMLRYPDDNFFYKYTEVTEFADCVEFYTDFANRSTFGLSTYYKMCEELIEAAKQNSALMEKHNSRFLQTDRPLYPDPKLHILAFDIMYTSQAYDFYDGISYVHLDSKEKKSYLEKQGTAEKLKLNLETAKAKFDELIKVQETILSLSEKETRIYSLRNKEGKILSFDAKEIQVLFEGDLQPKKFGFSFSLANKLLKFKDENINQYIEKHAAILKSESEIKSKYKHALNNFKDYAKYLE